MPEPTMADRERVMDAALGIAGLILERSNELGWGDEYKQPLREIIAGVLLSAEAGALRRAADAPWIRAWSNEYYRLLDRATDLERQRVR